MKALWLTDLHLNYFSIKKKDNILNSIKIRNPDCLFLTGDISNGKNIEKDLNWLAQLNIPIYFVFGNHCFYWSSFKNNDNLNLSHNLYLLDKLDPIIINDTAILGHTGWYGVGDVSTYLPFVFLPDWIAIKELRQFFSYSSFLDFINYKSFVATQKIIEKIKFALEKDIKTIYLLTHFPPFVQKYGNIFTAHFWTHFESNKFLLKELKNIMSNYLNKELILLSGHTHQEETHKFDNITVLIGKANLCNPNAFYEFIFD